MSSPKKMIAIFIDDDQDDMDFLTASMRATACFDQILCFGSAIQAMKFLEENEILPDLIITDINMPLVSGMDLLGNLKNNLRLAGIPIIIFSNSDYHATIDQAKMLGANAYITKPYKLEHFDHIAGLLARFATTNQMEEAMPKYFEWFGEN